ncbi:VPLPA-CTERM sorting domain-containing protein [Parvularcula sp. ZS-1/3]|uniref:VPLPA-CTERM sorting domain-containing protein n=1 Tax=Parvularcula mediterranea TaxID=2732508 RepID=A0A7Y3W4W2_9PROT|nr:VPLPA-CTERM sorting domain-containing protein [Parvularcula mediterranea]NNU15893.1 VPLPA-CTERM sorting domain-containing protein [Parvularcula mediterranea]
MRTITTMAACAAAALSAPALAATTVLDFEGLGNNELVGNFYNGGAGANYGISFSNALGLIDADAGGTGNFANEASADTVIYFLSGGAATMNVANGFSTGFSFFYTTNSSGSVTVYDGLNGTGNVLASIDLDPTPTGPGDPGGSGPFNTFRNYGVSFVGTALSVDFGGVANRVAFDNITLGATSAIVDPVPVPAAGLLLLTGLGGMALRRRRKA